MVADCGGHTRNNDVLVVSHQVFQDGEGSRLDVDISPVNPAVGRPQGSTEQPVTGLCHALSSARLCGKAVSTLDVLVDLLAKVLFDDGDFSKRDAFLFFRLQIGQQIGEEDEGVVFGVSDEEGEVDQMVRVCQVAQMREEHWKMRGGIS